MHKLTASFLGPDCPGVVAAVAGIFAANNCNIEAMSQAALASEFTAIFVVNAPDDLNPEHLRRILEEGLACTGVDLSVTVRPATGNCWAGYAASDPFVITVDGPDGPGLIAAMSRIFARHGVNITNLTAILYEEPKGNALFVFEVMVPGSADIGRLRRELILEGKNLGLRVGVQHRDIFEAVHRVKAY